MAVTGSPHSVRPHVTDTTTSKTHRSKIKPRNAAQSADKLPAVPMGSDSEMQEYAAPARRDRPESRPVPSPADPAAATR